MSILPDLENIDIDISDGYHTFAELYAHRDRLFIALMLSNKELSWYSDKHADGTMYSGSFIAGMRLPTGDISYHMGVSLLPLLNNSGIIKLEYAPEYDGYTSDDVLQRLEEWINNDVR